MNLTSAELLARPRAWWNELRALGPLTLIPALAGTLGLAALAAYQGAFAAFVVFALVAALAAAALTSVGPALVVCYAAFLLRALVGLLAPLAVGADEPTYTARGALIAEAWAAGELRPISLTSNGYFYVSAAVQAVFGHGIHAPRLMNAAVGAILVALAYALALELSRHRGVAFAALAFVALYPDLIQSAALNHKDTLLAATVAGCVLLVARGLARHPGRIAALAAGLGLVAFIRYPYVMGILWTAAFVGLARFLSRRRPQLAAWKVSASAFGITVAVGLAVTLLVPAVNALAGQFVQSQFNNSSQGVQDALSDAHPALLKMLPDEDRLNTPANYAVSAIRTLGTPHPFYVLFDRDTTSVLASVGGVAWYIAVPLATTGVILSRRDFGSMSLVAWLLATFAVLSTPVVAIVGAPFRWRVPVLAFFLYFAALGLIRSQEESATRRMLLWFTIPWILFAIGTLLVYVILRT